MHADRGEVFLAEKESINNIFWNADSENSVYHSH